MDTDFTAEEWTRLSKAERLLKCEILAIEAEKLEQTALAAEWRRLASEIATDS
jgi:hypothetical protein